MPAKSVRKYWFGIGTPLPVRLFSYRRFKEREGESWRDVNLYVCYLKDGMKSLL